MIFGGDGLFSVDDEVFLSFRFVEIVYVIAVRLKV